MWGNQAPSLNPWSPEFSSQEQSMLDYRRWFVLLTTPARGHLFFNSITLYACDAADVMDTDNSTIVLESFFIILSFCEAHGNIKNVSVFDHLVLSKKYGKSPKRAFWFVRSHFCEYEWFKWVMFWDEMALYLDDHFKQSRYLWPSIDVGLAMIV